MEYQFSFTRLRLLLLLVVSLIAAALIFVGGVATGRRIALPVETPQPASALNAKVTAAKSAVKLPALPASPVLPAAPASPAEAPVATAPASTVPASTVAPVSTPPATVAVAVSNPADLPYVLQVGAFRDTKGAKDLQTDLQKKGYATTVYNMLDQDQRNWHMVRFGAYKDVTTASKAASDFTGKEGIQALVKRFDSL